MTLADWDAAVEAEERRVAETIRQARASGTSAHDGYWKSLYAIRERRRAYVRVMEALGCLDQ